MHPALIALGGAAGGMGLAGMFPPLARWMAHGMNRTWTNEILSVGQYPEALRRGIVTPDEFDYDMRSMGLSEKRQGWINQLALQLFPAVEAIILWRRQEIDDEALKDRLHKVGIPEDDMDLWVKFTETRPSVTDIIRFAVREVYSPDIASQYGLFEGAEAIAATAADDLMAAGIRPEDLAKWWGSHWVLPALTMGYEMLHRGIITDDELMTLMRTQDIMPYWRDKLVQISYNPLTRVDVRRMHKLGVLTDEQVKKAYMDIGYNDENAQRMLEFTIAYNADPNDSEVTVKDKQRDLTKTDIIKGYADGLFTEQEAGDALIMLGYDQAEVEYYFSRVAFEQDKEVVDIHLKAYRQAYLGNTMTRNEITEALNKLNLAGKRIENLFNVWDVEKTLRVNKPTKSEILTFLRKKIIDRPTAERELLGMGYNETYVGWYLATA